MPGLDFFFRAIESSPPVVPRILRSPPQTPTEEYKAPFSVSPSPERPLKNDVYYNPRLDPKNFLEGPLSWDPATRLRQMLARPGIVVCTCFQRTIVVSHSPIGCPRYLRWYQRPLRTRSRL